MALGCAQACREVRRLDREVGRLREENARLRVELDKVRREGRRQAGPFSKGAPKTNPRPPGRRPGEDYGPKAHRRPPERVDEVLEAPLPACCPDCAGRIEDLRVERQFHVELPPVVPHVTQFNVHIGKCEVCGKRVQGRHGRQTSDALGAAASQVGPRALALATDLNKGLGLSLGKIERLFADVFDIQITPGGIYQALHRVARVAQPTYGALVEWVRRDAPVVSPDETGWRMGGLPVWLWAFATPTVVVYAIMAGRGFEQAAAILGEHFDGGLARDGWAVYRRFLRAYHQSCLAHLLRRCKESLETALRGTARVPHAIKKILQAALALRDRRDLGLVSPHGLAVARGRIEARMDRLLRWQPKDEENRRFLKHLRNERTALFTFLYRPEIPATNWWSEQAIRPAVVNRKVWGGNRTDSGGYTQQILTTLLQTCRLQKQDPSEILVHLLRSPEPTVANILIPTLSRRTTNLSEPQAPS